MLKISGIEDRVTLPFNPRANGITEIKVKLVKQVIFKQLDGLLSSWSRFIASTQLFINLKIAELHSSSPFALMFGRASNTFSDFGKAPLLLAFESDLQTKLEYMNAIVYPSILSATLAKSAKRN